MSLYKQFSMDQSLEKKGILLEYGENSDGTMIALRIARAGGSNKRYERRLEKAFKPYRRQIQAGTADEKVLRRALIEVFAETVVLGWENVHDENGEPLPFTKDNCVKLFNDLPDFFDDVRDAASSYDLFRQDEMEVDAKN